MISNISKEIIHVDGRKELISALLFCFEQASFTSSFLENLYDSSRRLNVGALKDDSVSTVSSRLSESTLVTVAARSRPQVDASVRSAVNYLEVRCFCCSSLSVQEKNEWNTSVNKQKPKNKLVSDHWSHTFHHPSY